ncbi:hemerythrin domain-containing protein [Neobacillus sp. PS3-34]|uniref:hemerythrin domain-containing protein n=1 Tax=Neobacillus sp. PS3-34 TaxID=3070678 RepID=UPI0027DFB6D8|nr:hemerythrin domain-containing protein [Neobacillus sp. PS3-34]WML49443.1 hemerythrin domain-containing protein [Neobacillus sp. PS3-34]
MSGCMSGFGGLVSGKLSVGLNQLKNEHPSLLDKLEGIFSLVKQIETEYQAENPFNRLKEKVSEFMAELGPHSEREEGVLFPMMGTYIGTTSGPIAVMEYEHDQAKKLIGTFIEQTSAKDEISEQKIKELAGFIKNAYFILTEHFSKEENVLFPMAERMLSEEEKAELFRRIQEIK